MLKTNGRLYSLVRRTFTLGPTCVVSALLLLSTVSLGWVMLAAPDASLPRGQFLLYGPEEFSRGTGKPTTTTKSFAAKNTEADYFVRLTNGGTRGQLSRSSSASVVLNGREIYGPSDFNQNAPVLERGVSLSPENVLGVELRGAPNSGLDLSIIGIDNEPPTINASADPAPNAAGWNSTNVSVSFDCADATSGIAYCAEPVSVQTEGANQLVTGTARDLAQNESSTSVSLNIDKTRPALSINSPAGGTTTNAGEIVIAGSVSDSLSGVVSVTCNGTNATLTGTAFNCLRPLSAGPNVFTIRATDAAGNEATANLSVTRQEGETLRGVSLQPDVIFVGESKAVTITARIPYVGTTPPAVTLERMDETGVVAEGMLVDDGGAASGDALKGDGLFTFRRTYAAQATGRILFRVSYQKNGRTVTSEPLKLGFYEHLTDAQLDSIISTQQTAAALYESLMPVPGDDEEAYEAAQAAARDAVVAELRRNPGVIEAGVSDDGGTISILHAPGILGGIYLNRPGTRGGGGTSAVPPSQTIANLTSQGKTVTPSVADGSARSFSTTPSSVPSLAPQDSVDGEEDDEANKIKSRRALVVSPFYSEFAPFEESEQVKQKLEQAACCGFEVDYLRDQAVTPDTLKNLHRYGVIAVVSHGVTISQGVIYRSAFFNLPIDLDVYALVLSQELNVPLMHPYEADLLAGRLATITVAETGTDKTFLAVMPSFIPHYSPEEFPNTLVYFGTCYSAANDTMARAFIGQGAKTYLGFTDVVSSGFAQQVGLEFFDRFLNDPLRKTGGEDGAYIPNQYDILPCYTNSGAWLRVCDDPIREQIIRRARGAKFEIFGSEELERPGVLVNAGFEAGNMSSWYSTFPSSRAIGQLGEFRPTQGRYMGMVSKIESWFGLVAQNFCLPTDATRIDFDYNLITGQGCGSPFLRSDELWVRITGPGVYHQVLTTGVTAQCSRLRPSSIVLPTGSARATGWQHGSFDITNLAQRLNGQRVSLRFEVVKAVFNGDNYTDTVVLVDNVRIVR